MARKKIVFLILMLCVFSAIVTGFYFYVYSLSGNNAFINNNYVIPAPGAEETTGEELPPIPQSYHINLPNHYYQTFNNCGPATLTMVLNYYGVDVTQQTLGNILRPYQNPQGDNDDKSTTLIEMEEEAKRQGFTTFLRANGTIETLNKFTSNNIPVAVKTWLESNDDIGHFRIVTGYNNQSQYIIQDDSYQGPNRNYSYREFLELWQPFNYQMLIIVTSDKAELVESILGEDVDIETNWANTLARAQNEEGNQPNNPYPIFNQAVAQYYLGNFDQSVSLFEKVQDRLPRRMLWYQLEPIGAYVKTGEYQTALNLIDNILNNGNRAFSELYILREEIFMAQGDTNAARKELESAVFYNENMQRAKNLLDSLE